MGGRHPSPSLSYVKAKAPDLGAEGPKVLPACAWDEHITTPQREERQGPRTFDRPWNLKPVT